MGDDYLQKELSNSKEPKPDLKKCFNEVISAESRLKALKDITQSITSVDASGVNISYVSNSHKKIGYKSGNKSYTGAKPKEVYCTKTGDKQNHQNHYSTKPKPKQYPKGRTQNKKKSKYCSHHKENNSHSTKDCLVLKNRTKKIHKVDEYDSEDDNFGYT